MGALSGLGDFFDENEGFFDPTGDVAGFTGRAGADAAREGAAAQTAAGREALALLRSDLDPFKQLGVQQIEGAQSLASDRGVQDQLLQSSPEFQQLQSLSTDPNAQADFLSSNPLFSSLREQASQDIFSNQAARGKLGSTGTEELLQSRFLELGDSLINQQIGRTSGALGARENVINQQLNRQLPLLDIGQASAAQVGAGGSEILQGIGNAQAAGGIGASNALAAGGENVVGGAASLLGFLSDERFKESIVKTGNHNGVNCYSWTWKDSAQEFGCSGDDVGHIAQELMITHPHLVYDNDGVLSVNYDTDETMEISKCH